MPLQGSRGFRRTSELRPGAACVPSRVREEWQRAGRGGGDSGRGCRLAGVPLCELDSGRAGPSLGAAGDAFFPSQRLTRRFTSPSDSLVSRLRRSCRLRSGARRPKDPHLLLLMSTEHATLNVFLRASAECRCGWPRARLGGERLGR